MVPSETNPTPSGKPSGDLEQLFRQKFAEAEVAPRASLWEQIDRELVVKQNETYRRGLVFYRWAAAASILLLLSLGSWFGLHRAAELRGEASLAAQVEAPLPAEQDNAAGIRATPATPPRPEAGTGHATAAASFEGAAVEAAPTSSQLPGSGAAANRGRLAKVSTVAKQVPTGLRRSSGASAGPTGTGRSATTGEGASQGSLGQVAALGAMSDEAGNSAAATVAHFAQASQGMAARMVSLSGGSAFYRPNQLQPLVLQAAALGSAEPALAAVEEQPETPTAHARRWRLFGAYEGGAFNPNINFSRPTVAAASTTHAFYSVAGRTSNTYDEAAAEYRARLRAGASHRVQLGASYAAGKRWAIVAGLEAAEQYASSATSFGFQDGKLPEIDPEHPAFDLNNSPGQPTPQLQATHYRYRTVGMPVSARYNSAKTGWSVYAKVGAAVDLLLSSRSELEGQPEATRTYTAASGAYSPYRRVQASLRGGAGVRFQPAKAAWSIALGPDAQASLTTLNTNSMQPLLHRSRPYAIGLAASVDFGGHAAVAMP